MRAGICYRSRPFQYSDKLKWVGTVYDAYFFFRQTLPSKLSQQSILNLNVRSLRKRLKIGSSTHIQRTILLCPTPVYEKIFFLYLFPGIFSKRPLAFFGSKPSRFPELSLSHRYCFHPLPYHAPTCDFGICPQQIIRTAYMKTTGYSAR